MRTHSDGDSPGRASAGLESEWNRFVLPGSQVEKSGGTWRFINLESGGGQYTDAQIDDYQGLPRRRFKWNPPLTMTVRARFSHAADELIGTAGFGFWNDPFLMTGFRPPALPRAIWFFYSSAHSNIKLAREAPGWGWKAATIDAVTLPFFLLAPTAPLAVPLMNVPPLYRWLWPVGQRAIKVSESAVGVEMAEWHRYELVWGETHAAFSVDGKSVLACDTAPGGPLGFVMWIDNQAMVLTPWGRFGYRTLPVSRAQWLEVDELRIDAEIE
jgi:hypothetical protein